MDFDFLNSPQSAKDHQSTNIWILTDPPDGPFKFLIGNEIKGSKSEQQSNNRKGNLYYDETQSR